MFTIEKLECGVWVDQDYADDLETALVLAGSVCEHPCCKPEECWDAKIQIVTPDGECL